MIVLPGGLGSQWTLRLGTGETQPFTGKCGSVSQPHLLSALMSPPRQAGSFCLYVCLFLVPRGLLVKDYLLSGCAKISVLGPFKIYSFCALFNPDAQKAICCFIVGLHFLKRRLV